MRELISIIVPVYKVENYLHQCVDSILNQTYRNLEVILIDDGSPDSCGEICDQYAENDYRVKVIHQKNGGVSRARNAGLKVVKGQYISFVDGDDWVKPEYIEILYKLLIDYEADISLCNFVKTDGLRIKFNKGSEQIYQFSNIGALKRLYGKYELQMGVSWGKLFKIDLYKGIRFPVDKIHEDAFIAHRLFFKSDKTVFTTKQLLFYRQREDSITGKGVKLRNKLDLLEAYERRVVFLEKKGLDDIVKTAYKRVLSQYIDIYCYRDRFKDSDRKKMFLLKSDFLKKNLRKFNYNVMMKVFYELFFIVPDLMSLVYRIYSLKNRLMDKIRGR